MTSMTASMEPIPSLIFLSILIKVAVGGPISSVLDASAHAVHGRLRRADQDPSPAELSRKTPGCHFAPPSSEAQVEFSYIGCLKEPQDGILSRNLLSQRMGRDKDPESCAKLAADAGLAYFGLKYGGQCWAGTKFEVDAAFQFAPSGDCNMPCISDDKDTCGAALLLSTYAIPKLGGVIPTASSNSTIVKVPDLYNYIGCLREPEVGNTNRRLLARRLAKGQVDIKSCANFAIASGLPYFGLQFGDECWAGLNFILDATRQFVSPDDCNMKCTLNDNETCGAAWRLSTYAIPSLGGVVPTANTQMNNGQYTSIGCLREPFPNNPTNRILRIKIAENQDFKACAQQAQEKSYKFFGLQFGGECWAANAFPVNIATRFANALDCNMKCNSNPDENCGGFYRLQAYAMPGVSKDLIPTGTPSSDFYPIGCLKDNDQQRLLQARLTETVINIEQCAIWAGTQGYGYFGLQYGEECWGGRKFELDPSKEFAPLQECSMKCRSGEDCGGFFRMSAFYIPSQGGAMVIETPIL